MTAITFWKITPEQAARLTAVQRKQDHNAFALGVLEWEFTVALKKLLNGGLGGGELLESLGALHWEHADKRKFFLDTIERTETEQRALGESILCELGFDPDAHDYTLHEGRVLELQDGQWHPVPRPTVN